MRSEASSPAEYVQALPPDRKKIVAALRRVIRQSLPEGFAEIMSYGMIGYAVPHKLYPSGYHCDPKLPLPFMGLASQKNHVTVYHMAIYADKHMLDWFTTEYKRIIGKAPDMGKGCIRFRPAGEIPYELIGALAGKMNVREWVDLYEANIKK